MILNFKSKSLDNFLERERECVCVCVCVIESEKERESACVCDREREKDKNDWQDNVSNVSQKDGLVEEINRLNKLHIALKHMNKKNKPYLS